MTSRATTAVLRGLLYAGLFGAFCGAAAAQTYGGAEQTLSIGAERFEGLGLISDDGYVSGTTAFQFFWAPLALPLGAEVHRVCLFAYDAAAGHVTVEIVAVKLVPGGGTPAYEPISGTQVDSLVDIGYGYYCADPITFTLHGRADVDGDGTIDDVAYYVQAYLPGDFNLRLGAVQISWARQVSLPPLKPSFADVPVDDLAFRFVEALADSGITAGCGGGNFCPDAQLKRRQMAVFLAKALGLHWSN